MATEKFGRGSQKVVCDMMNDSADSERILFIYL